MVPSITTPTPLEKLKNMECQECRLIHDIKENCENNNNIETKPSPYDLTCPKNESKFFLRIREWEKQAGFITALRWDRIIVIALFHIIIVSWSFYALAFKYLPKWQTFVFGVITGAIAGFGVTAGAHRYWCHKSFKAKIPLQFILFFCYSMSGQNTIFNWVRDHRVHHKFSETSADPHDARRGFFFSHIGWLMMKKHPDVIKEGSKINMNDIIEDPLIQIHTKYFNWFKLAICFVLPTLIPVYGWGETWEMAFVSQPFVRYLLSLHFTWAVNSFAHLWGNKPYDKNIMPAENWYVSLVAMGEGWHNFHHTFPWDYKAAELPYTLNWTTVYLDAFARIGWAYDLKQTSPSLVAAVKNNRGEKEA